VSNDSQIPLSKKNQREMSPFIGHEFLYDYLSASLDEERKKAVEEHLKISKEAQLDLEGIKSGQAYAELLAGTNVSLPIIEYISESKNYLTVLLKKTHFEKWPQGVKWGLEALIVIFVIVVILLSVPWEKSLQTMSNWGAKEYTLAEITKEKTAEIEEDAPAFVDEGVKVPETADTKNMKPEQVAQIPKVEAVAPTNPALPKAPVDALKTPEVKLPSAVSKVVTETKPALPPVKPPVAMDEKVVNPPALPMGTAGVGYLYRGTISITNIEAVEPKITEKIEALGGRKAGSVELGWKKTENALYYHFTIPEARYTELLTFLSTYGTPKFSKEKHSRVMPDGIIRLIFNVDEKSK
jgi:hypothetical protein